MNERLGVGLVGVGWFGALCLEAYAEMPEIVVVAVADRDAGRARSVAPPGAHVYGDYGALLGDPRVDIVAVNTPPHLHGDMAVQAIGAGKHVFVEKPLATSVSAASAAVEAAQRAGVQLGIDYVLRHHPLHRLTAKVVASGVLGGLEHWALENFASVERLAPDHWFWDPARSGGIHVEHGVHFFDLCNQLAGVPADSVCATEQRRADGPVDRVSATVRYGDRLLATFYHSFDRGDREESTTIRLGLSRGHLTIEGWIPTGLALVGLVRPAEVAVLRNLFGAALKVGDTVRDPVADPEALDPDQLFTRVRASASAPDRWRDYRRAIQAGMRDLVAAARGQRELEVTPSDGLRSLELATRAAASGSGSLAADSRLGGAAADGPGAGRTAAWARVVK